jgi:hypothetical protein
MVRALATALHQLASPCPAPRLVRVRVEIMGPGKYDSVGKSQSVLIMINPIIFTRTRRLEKSLD